MAEFGAQVIPFSSSQGCGDFAFAVERPDGLLVVLGDVAGHGDPIVGALCASLEKYIRVSANLSLADILEGSRNLPGITERGVSIFLGLFDNQLPLLHYYLLGDVSAYLVRDEQEKRLVSHEGALGISPPELNRFHSIKAEPHDLCIIHSDGVREGTLIKLIRADLDLQPPDLAQQFMKLGRRNEDDAACAVVRFRGKRHLIAPVKAERVVTKPAKKSVQTVVETLPTRHPLPFVKLDEEQRLARVKDVPQARLLCTLLWEVVELDRFNQSRFESFLLEALERTGGAIEIYADDLRIQLQLSTTDILNHLAARLFGPRSFTVLADRMILTLVVNSRLDLPTRMRLGHLMSQQSYRDYSDRHRREGLLAQQAKLAAMGEMIGAIAHQWRQPLNELGLRVQQLQLHQHKSSLTTEEVDSYAADSLKLISHMAATIDDFRDFFSTQQDDQRFDVAKVVQDVLRLQAAQLKNHNIEIRLDGESFSVTGHASYLKQVLFNLISNSKDAFVEQQITNPKIAIQLDPRKHSLVLTDNGGGVTPQILERIYEPYYTQKEHGKGTGLGLYMSRMLMLDHFNGSIDSSNTVTDGEPGLQTRLAFGNKDIE